MVEIGWVGGSGLSFEEVPVRRRDECWQQKCRLGDSDAN